MIKFLKLAGIGYIVIGLAAGAMSGSGIGLFLGLAGGVLSSAIPFGVAKLLENQEIVLTDLYTMKGKMNVMQIEIEEKSKINE
ncbi:MAG: hypothetical protein BGN88_02235 [Clostridiales bacterium 43-6]|nr:MAG: hypothetical protein BGN88_02235 [Clostridiales bacterium 43-6]